MTYDRIGGYSEVASLAVATDVGSAYASGDLIGGKLSFTVDRFFERARACWGPQDQRNMGRAY